MTQEQAEKIYTMHKELVALACIQTGCTLPPTDEQKARWRRKEIAFKRYLESLIGNYLIIPVKDCQFCKENSFGSFERK